MITRFYASEDGVWEHPRGDFCYYSEVEEKLAEIKKLRALLVEACDMLYWDVPGPNSEEIEAFCEKVEEMTK